MKEIVIKLTRDNFDYKFKQYEGKFFHATIDENSEIVKYKVTADEAGKELKEFGNTHIKDENFLFFPQLDIYIDLKKMK